MPNDNPIPCPHCQDTKHQTLCQRIELGGILHEVWDCANPAGNGNAATGTVGCGSHTHEVDES